MEEYYKYSDRLHAIQSQTSSKFTGNISNNTSKSTSILVSFASKSIPLFVTFFHAIISHDYRFFFQVPPLEESQDPGSSPRREEVGRRALGACGGFLLPFFYRARFQL